VGAEDEFDGLANEFAGGGVVGDEEVSSADFGERAEDDVEAEGLRGLDGPEAGAVEGAFDEISIAGFLDGVGHGLSGDGCAGLAGGFDGRSDEGFGGAGPGGILDSDDLSGGRQGLQAVPNGVLAFFAAGNQVELFLEIVFASQLLEGGLQAITDNDDNFLDA